MISRCGLLTKKEGMSTEEFGDYWLNVHGPIAAKMENLKHYSQHLVINSEHKHNIGAGPIVIDGYSELQFDTYGDMVAGVNSLHGEGADDVPKFANPRCPVVVMVKKWVKEVSPELRGKKLVKRVSFLGRKEGVSDEQFQREWWYVHTKLMETMPGFVGYAQNLVIDRLIDGKHVGYDEIPFEGMVEFWFEDMDGFNTLIDSPEFKRTNTSHAPEFIGGINTYLTEEYPVVK